MTLRILQEVSDPTIGNYCIQASTSSRLQRSSTDPVKPLFEEIVAFIGHFWGLHVEMGEVLLVEELLHRYILGTRILFRLWVVQDFHQQQ